MSFRDPTERDAPLAGLTVVAVEQAVAAPFCTMRLADAGARVIKIERPGGDFARGYDSAAAGQSSYFVWLNRGKESVVLDLATQVGRDALARLIASADVFVQNLKVGAIDRLGLSIASLRSRHPRLVCCSISGYGQHGPYAQRKAYDLLIQADSGLASITGGPNEPARVGISIVDIATGATAHAAVLEALIARGLHGRGSDIHVSMLDVMAEWLTVPFLHGESGNPPKRMGMAHPSIAPYGVFLTRDKRPLLIAIQSEREWKSLCEVVLSSPELVSDARFATNVLRVKNRAETDTILIALFAQLPSEVAIARLLDADIAFAEINDLAGLSRHPHLRRMTVATPNGDVSMPAIAATFDGVEREPGPSPALGDHTDRVLGS